MRLLIGLIAGSILSLTSARFPFSSPPPQVLFANDASLDFRIPTIAESAAMARRMMHFENLGNLATVFQSDAISDSLVSESRERGPVPKRLAGVPTGLLEYFADCEPETNNPTILAVTLATAYKNAAAGSNVSLSIRWNIPNPRHHLLLTPAALPRFSLMGHLERIPLDEVEEKKIASCFVKAHPEAHIWLPGNDIHFSEFVRLVVDEVYWFGGFGDRSYIGWVPETVWRDVSMEDWQGARLPGE